MSKEETAILRELIDGSIQNGYSPLPVNDITGIWVLGLGALTISGLDLSQKKSIIIDEPTLEKKLLSYGDFLISRSNTREKVGMASLFKGGLDACIYPDLMMRFRVNAGKININYLDHFLRSPSVQGYFSKKAAGTSGSMVKITKATVEKLPVFLPALEEQKAIAVILSTWDEAIEKTERLIELKEAHFLSITTRVFIKNSNIKNWSYSKLSHLVRVKKGMQLNRTELQREGKYPAWNGGITPSGYTDTWNTEENTVSVSEGGNSCGFVNFCREKFWCGGHCYSLIDVNEKIIPIFLYLYLKTNEKRIMRLRVGSGLPNIQKGDIENFQIIYPNIEEQKVISSNLIKVLDEISLLKDLSILYKQQKRGLMQKLLTGKWRVKIKEENHNEQL